ncbi:hypothetical protein BH23GEM4_BH23GEM4_02850 [soil metagenome]
MPTALTPPRAALGGAAVLMACACGTATNAAALAVAAGVGVTTVAIHPLFIVLGAALVTYGLWRTAPLSGQLALAAFGILAVAAALAPPRIMSSKAMPWNEVQIFGGALYLVAAALLGYAFWRAFPSREPAASATAIGGAVVATGCSCCMFTGALAGLAATGGASVVQSTPLLFWTGLAIVALGLFRLGGWRAAVWSPVGGAVIEYGPELLKLTGDWMWGEVNFRSFGQYALTIAGAGLVLYGFVVAYRRGRPEVVSFSPPLTPRSDREPELVGA